MAKLFSITGTSPSSATTAVVGLSAIGTEMRNASEIKIVAELVGATGGTLDVYLQWTPDGTTWYDYCHFPQLAGAAAAVKYSTGSNYPTPGITVIGKDSTPALAANTCVGGSVGNGLRCVCVAGVGTSAGAAVTINIWAK